MFAFGLIRPMQTHAAQPTFSEASQRLMAVSLNDGLSVSDGIPIYPVGTEYYLPIGELSQALGLSIEVAPNLGKAAGTVLSDGNTYMLDLEDCTVEHDGKLDIYDCDEAAQFDNDIYVSVGLIEKSLPLKIKVNIYRSELIVEPRQKLPEQIRIDREKQIGRHKSGFPHADVPSTMADGWMLDQQLGFNRDISPDTAVNTYRYDSVATGELFGMEASAFFGGTNRSIERQRYTLARRDPNGGILWPLSAKDIQLGDVTFPSMPLVGGGGVYRGALVSSYNLQSQTQFGTRDFIGDIASGWEVELYQNDVLIDRRQSTSGRYEFKGIPLLYGQNRFRLAFYGPQGQRRETYESYAIDSAFLQPNAQSYRFAFGDTQINNGRWLAQFDQSLMENVTLVSALARTTEVQDVHGQPIVYSLLGARAFTKDILYSTTASVNQRQGFAWENGAQGPLLGAIVGASYTRLSDFVSEIFPKDNNRFQSDVFRANTAFNVSNFRLVFEGSRVNFQEGGGNLLFTQRTSTKTGRINWFHSLTYDRTAGNTNGELSALTQMIGYDLRAAVMYNVGNPNPDVNKTSSFTTEVRKNLSDKLSITAGYQDQWINRLRRVYTSLNRQFENFTLSANAATHSNGFSSIGALLSFGLDHDPRSGETNLKTKALALYGAASVFVFLDANQNGRYDPNEKPLKDVELRVNQGNTGVMTNDRGIGVLTNLSPYLATDVTISLRSLEDPFQRPNPKGLRFIPRPGKYAHLDLPVIVATEITGFVRTRDNRGGLSGRPRRGLAIRLTAADGSVVRETKTESDGYYLLDELKAGKYRLEIDPRQLKAQKMKISPESYEIEITPEGLLDNVKDFELEVNDSGRLRAE